MSRVCFSSDKALFEKGVHNDLNTLARHRAGTGELRNRLRTETIEAAKNATAAGGLGAMAMQLGGKRAQAVRQGTNLVKKANSGASTILHDNYIVIMTIVLSTDRQP